MFETEPVSSLLDIFWETSTSGIVSNLNNFILNESGGSSSLANWSVDSFCEDTTIGSTITDASFFPVDNFGNAIPLSVAGSAGIISLVLTQVLDNESTPVNVQLPPNPAFTFVDNTDGTYDITTNQVFVRGVNAIADRNFTFYFTLTTSDGAGSESVNNFTETATVCNKDPLFGASPFGSFTGEGFCPPYSPFLETSAQNSDVIYKFYGRNGSVDDAAQEANGGVYEDVTFSLVSVLDSNSNELGGTAFELTNITAWNSATGEPPSAELLRVTSFVTSGSYVLTVRVIDADGASVDCVFGVTLLNPGCTCTTFNCRVYGFGTHSYTNCSGGTSTFFCSETQASNGTLKTRCARGGADGEECDPTTC